MISGILDNTAERRNFVRERHNRLLVYKIDDYLSLDKCRLIPKFMVSYVEPKGERLKFYSFIFMKDINFQLDDEWLRYE